MADKSIKSVRRVFEILELFDKERRPLSAKEIADRLNYPLASAHMLMKSMHQLGYVDFDSPKWTYIPSRNFSKLSVWIAEFLGRETRLLDCMAALNQATKETVNLSRLLGDEVKIVRGLECVQAVGVSVKVGTVMPVLQSLTGLTALASLTDADLSEFLSRSRNTPSAQPGKVDRDLIEDVKRELRERGTVTMSDVFIQGIGAVCLPVQTDYSEESMIIGVVGPSDRISQHEAEHRRTIKRVTAEFGIKCQFKLRNPRKSG